MTLPPSPDYGGYRRRTRSADAVPADYDELHRMYRQYMTSLVLQGGIDPQQADDVVSLIMEKLLSRDIIRLYNPDQYMRASGTTVPPMFRTFLTAFVRAYLRHHVHRQRLTAWREPLTIDGDARDGDGVTELPNTVWAEPPASAEDDALDELEPDDELAPLRARLSGYDCGEHTAVEVLDAAAASVNVSGTVSTKMLALRLGISRALAEQQLHRLRDLLSAA